MKKIILIVSCLLSINILADSDASNVAQDIVKAIKKSDIEALKLELSKVDLPENQISNYVYLAKKVAKLRRNKLWYPTKYSIVGTGHKLAAILAMTCAVSCTCGVLLGWAEGQSGIEGIVMGSIVDVIVYFWAKNLWKKGEDAYRESIINKRTPKQKYLDSLQIKQILEDQL